MNLGDYPLNGTVKFKFSTNAATGARVDPSSAWEAADIRVYKDGSTTERSSTSGFTVTSTFDSMTGITHVTIDLSDNTDAGFYAAGSEYDVVLYPDETVDGVSVAAVLAHFSIRRMDLMYPSFTVGTDSGNSRTQVETTRTETVNDYWDEPSIVVITSGALIGESARIAGYNGTTKIMTFQSPGFTSTPADGVSMIILNR